MTIINPIQSLFTDGINQTQKPVAGRLIAGDSFKQQNTRQAAFNQQTQRATGQSSNGGRVYSKFGNDPTIENIGANTPFGASTAQDNFFNRLKDALKGEITLRVKSNDSHIVGVVQDNANRKGIVNLKRVCQF